MRRTSFILGTAALCFLFQAASAEEFTNCKEGAPATVSGTIHEVYPERYWFGGGSDGKAGLLLETAEGDCHIAIIELKEQPAAACVKGGRITASGKMTFGMFGGVEQYLLYDLQTYRCE